MLSGKGAYNFAISKGFKHTNLLTESSKKDGKMEKENNLNFPQSITKIMIQLL